MGPEGAKHLSEALSQNKTLTSLDISGAQSSNIGGVAGAKHVADMLMFNRVVTTLVLSLNDLGPEGGAAIAEALKVPASCAARAHPSVLCHVQSLLTLVHPLLYPPLPRRSTGW